MPSCKGDLWIDGLGAMPHQFDDNTPLPISFYITCHECQTDAGSNFIPTYGIALSANTIISPNLVANEIGHFGIPSINDFEGKPFDQITKVEQTSCQLRGLITNPDFPTACAIQQIDINKSFKAYSASGITLNDQSTDNLPPTNPICVACLPKYKATKATEKIDISKVVPRAILSCTLIQNCASSHTFNRCDKCESGFALEESSNGESCVASTILNCKIIHTSVCKLCDEGYRLNPDGLCDNVQVFQCKETRLGYFDSLPDVEMFHFEGFGCLECHQNHVLVKFPEAQKICISNAYLSDLATHPTNGKLYI